MKCCMEDYPLTQAARDTADQTGNQAVSLQLFGFRIFLHRVQMYSNLWRRTRMRKARNAKCRTYFGDIFIIALIAMAWAQREKQQAATRAANMAAGNHATEFGKGVALPGGGVLLL